MHKIHIPLDSVRAVVFDMDGTMIDNMAYHKKAWQEFMHRHGMKLTDKEFEEKIAGRKNHQILECVFGRKLSKEKEQAFTEEKESMYRELFSPNIKEVSGLCDTIAILRGSGIKTAVATTAPSKNRDFALKALGLEGKFDVILGDEHVTSGKPHPEIYTLAATELGVSPSECLVFEDSPPGIAAAKAAGMKVIGMLTSHPAAQLREADDFITDFRQVHFA